jgi:hypothetical protein
MIILEEVEVIQNDWSNSLLELSALHQKNIDISNQTSDFIDRLYFYDFGDVLFKPTLASQTQFRKTKEGALSYFIGNNNKFPEDSGFALKSWTNIIWENSSIKIIGNIALAMGNYYFINNKGKLKVEFSFVYKKDENNNLRIILHDSHLPYKK